MDAKASVLIVEDEAALAELFEIWLADRYALETVTAGADAIERIDDGFDAVVLDWRMPDVSGEAVLEHVRTEDLAVRVVVVTGMELVVEDVEGEADAVLRKPVSADELVSTVEELLAGPGPA